MALELTQPLIEMSIRIFHGGKGGQCVGLTSLPPSCAIRLEIWDPQTPGNLRAWPGLEWNCFALTNGSGFLVRYSVPIGK